MAGIDADKERWHPVNSLKNSTIAVQFFCSSTEKRYVVSDDDILGSTTLQELVRRVKKDIPALYLWDEQGGQVLVCGPNEVFQSEWDGTMLCELVRGDEAPKAVLEDGREAYVVTIGTPETAPTKPTVVQRCLAKGDAYG